jgi:cyclic-di-GMP phosphodiesterase, flagellum assembly factor TipF
MPSGWTPRAGPGDAGTRRGGRAIIRHVLIAAIYAGLCVAVAVLRPINPLPGAAPGGIAVIPGWAAGLAIFVFLAGLHLALARAGRFGEIERQNEVLASELAQARMDMDGMREDLARVRDALDQIPDTSSVVAELRVVQGLLEQIPAKHRGGDTARATESASDEESAVVPYRGEAMVVYDEDDLLKYIERALREDRVELFLQPIVTLPQRKRVYYECFSRIRGDGGQVITPDQYIQLAERVGLVAAIDNLLLFKCVQLVRRAKRDHLSVGFFCNISNASLTDVDFFTDFIDFMAANKHLSESLLFEFDQASMKHHDYETQVSLQRLAALGFRFSLDQVRDLHLDLPQLASQGFKFVKIDAHMLHELARGDDPRLDMRALKGALDRCAMDLIVEKIETDDMLIDLLELKIDYGQGFLFGEPRPSAGAG